MNDLITINKLQINQLVFVRGRERNSCKQFNSQTMSQENSEF